MNGAMCCLGYRKKCAIYLPGRSGESYAPDTLGGG